ncbi:MAG: thermonuclease family protein [Deltaproteobacteria bacterium]|nr:thermonuclease family protein [Deltaproteobacteria bacterium]
MHTDDRSSRRRAGWGLALLAGLTFLSPQPAEAAEPRSRVILNGELVQVTFNDGDSFRVLGGDLKGAKARLAGYNTLESYGPVHLWGTWTAKEMYVIAKMATLHARRGVWECSSDGSLDTYGRMLVVCPALREDLVRRGMAHVMTIDDQPGDATLLAAQREAQKERRGIWAHGIPAFILTSLHSVEEDTTGEGSYNRLISSDDAHSVQWRHSNRYSECSKVCHMTYDVSDEIIDSVTAALREDTAVAVIVEPLDDAALRRVVAEFAEFRHIGRDVPPDQREPLRRHMMGYVSAGKLGTSPGQPAACMIHVDFKRRFGTGRAACLK